MEGAKWSCWRHNWYLWCNICNESDHKLCRIFPALTPDTDHSLTQPAQLILQTDLRNYNKSHCTARYVRQRPFVFQDFITLILSHCMSLYCMFCCCSVRAPPSQLSTLVVKQRLSQQQRLARQCTGCDGSQCWVRRDI